MAPDSIADAADLNAATKVREDATKRVEEVRLAVTTAGAKSLELYKNPLSDEARQPWEKILKAQVTQVPCKDIFKTRVPKPPKKNVWTPPVNV